MLSMDHKFGLTGSKVHALCTALYKHLIRVMVYTVPWQILEELASMHDSSAVYTAVKD